MNEWPKTQFAGRSIPLALLLLDEGTGGRGGKGTPGHWDTMQACTPPASTMTERTPPAKCTLPATNKERTLRTRDPRSGGVFVVDGRDNAWRSRAPGPHAHRNTARQVVDGLRTEVCGQQKYSNDPCNNQHNPNTPTTGRR